MKSKLYTEAEVRRRERRAADQAILHTVERVYEYVLIAMLDNGVDKSTAKDIMHTADSIIDSIVSDDITTDDLRQVLRDEYGLEINIVT